jgi:hypothetical protein
MVLATFRGTSSDSVPWLPDLTLWHHWHSSRGTLPAEYSGLDLAGVAAALGVPAWAPVRPWRAEHAGVSITQTQTESERVVLYETSAGQMTARWARMPDGDWWQTEYPVKSEEEIPAMRAVVEGRSYVVNLAAAHTASAAVGERGAAPLELPRRAYSEVLHVFLGWSEGLMLLLGDEGPAIVETIQLLEDKVLACTRALAAALPGQLALSPDNLDGQFITPAVYREHLSSGYRQATEALHATGTPLVVHCGSGVRRLLSLLATDGVAALEGVSGPPQGDTALAQARALAGDEMVLWGGIPQDLLLESTSDADFEAGVIAAAREARAVGRAILGVADYVPVAALPARLRSIPGLVASA